MGPLFFLPPLNERERERERERGVGRVDEIRACVRARLARRGQSGSGHSARACPPRAVEKKGACSGCRAHSDSTGGYACSVKASGLPPPLAIDRSSGKQCKRPVYCWDSYLLAAQRIPAACTATTINKAQTLLPCPLSLLLRRFICSQA